MIAAAGVTAASPAGAAPPTAPTSTWVVDTQGQVYGLARSDHGTLYMTGSFSQIGPYTGHAVVLDGQGQAGTWPKFNGTVRAIVSDGSGGWYVGGDFTKAGSTTRNRIAHVLSDGSVDSGFNPNADGNVHALAVSGSTLYAGGEFTSIGGQTRNRIAALGSSGSATAWNPNASAAVYTLTVSGSSVYAGGDFTTIGGQTRNRIAELDATGAATLWNPNAGATVRALAVSGTSVYAGGDFTTIGGQTRNRIAELDATGAATAWNPNANNPVRSLAVSGSTVYAGGDFNSIGGLSRFNLAALNSSGVATSWNPGPGAPVRSIVVGASTVYVGGDFSFAGGQTRNRVAELNQSGTGTATSWNPMANGPVRAMALSGSNVYAGGDFTGVGGASRRGAAEVDLANGQVTSWNPNVNGTVNAVSVAGSTVYLGGQFSLAGGQSRQNVAAINSSGTATSWNPGASATVRALATSGSTVYVGGDFTTLGGQPRSKIGAVDGSGTVTGWNPSASGGSPAVYTLAASGSTVYAGGSFGTIGGQTRSMLAELDSTGAATSWNPSPNGSIRVVAPTASAVYVGGDFTTLGGQPRTRIGAVDSTGAATSWNPNASNTVTALATTGSNVFAGGRFTTIGGQSRNLLGALDASGAATSWNPSMIGVEVRSLVASGDTVYAGGWFTGIGGEEKTGFGAFVSAPVSGTAPALSGTAQTGQTLSVSTGGWENDPVTYAYQWYRDGVAIGGATGSTYTLGSADTDRQVRARVTAGNLAGSASADSNTVTVDGPPVNDSPPTITGTTRDGDTLTADKGTWRARPAASFAYQWRRCDGSGGSCTDIAGATGTTYTLDLADVGATIRVAVTGTNSGGSGTATSDKTATIAVNPDPPNSSANTWVTNYPAYTLARSDHGTVYLGGYFTLIGPYTGHGVALSSGTGSVSGAPKFNGTVRAVVSDGSGGWYVGGSFSRAGDTARDNLAHVLSDGSLDPDWNPGANGNVQTLAVSGSTLYAGGDFTTIGGQTRNRIAALGSSGSVTSWNPNANGTVFALTASGGSVYAAGSFTTIGGAARNRIAALDSTGAATSWNPGADAGVYALAVSGTTVYAGGDFTAIGGQPRNRIAALDATGAATGWNPGANSTVRALAGTNSKRLAKAVEIVDRSFEVFKKHPHDRMLARAAYASALLNYYGNNLEAAERMLDKAERVYAKARNVKWLVNCSTQRARIKVKQGKAGEALNDLQWSIDEAAAARLMNQFVVAQTVKGEAHCALREYDQAFKAFDTARTYNEKRIGAGIEVSSERNRGWILLSLAETHLRSGDVGAARKCLKEWGRLGGVELMWLREKAQRLRDEIEGIKMKDFVIESGTDELQWEKRKAELGLWMVGQAMLKTQSEKNVDLGGVLKISEKTVGKLKKGLKEPAPATRLSFPRSRKKR